MSAYFLGVDGGQSSTTAILGDETGRVLGFGLGGPCNEVASAVQSSVGEACQQAGLGAQDMRFSSACLGFSGGPADKESIVRQTLSTDRLLITDDAAIALAGATGGEPGLVVIAGTGSIAWGRNAVGRTARAGGWGYLFGDEGGALWIARQALRAALRWEEGWGAPTSLRARLLDATATRNVNDLLHRCYTAEFPRPRVAGFSILVNHAAESGDPAALKILDDAARELAILAIAVRRQLFAARGAGQQDPTLVAYSGRVFESRILLSRFRDWMAPESGVRVIPPLFPLHGPAMGALLEAYRVAGAEQACRGLLHATRPKHFP